MARTFLKVYIQAVFAVKGRENLIDKVWRDELYKYIFGIIKGLLIYFSFRELRFA